MAETPVVVAGVGGLGSRVASDIARLAPLTIELWDPGVVDEPDLNRQILYTPSSLGCAKCAVAAEALHRINEELTLHTQRRRITATTFAAESRVSSRTGDPPFVLFDCLDTFAARGELEAIRRATRCTVIHGGVEGWYGQVTTFTGVGAGYAEAFGPDFERRPGGAKPILPTTVAVVAALQVNEYIRYWVDGDSTPLTGAVGIYDGLGEQVERLEYRR